MKVLFCIVEDKIEYEYDLELFKEMAWKKIFHYDNDEEVYQFKNMRVRLLQKEDCLKLIWIPPRRK